MSGWRRTSRQLRPAVRADVRRPLPRTDLNAVSLCRDLPEIKRAFSALRRIGYVGRSLRRKALYRVLCCLPLALAAKCRSQPGRDGLDRAKAAASDARTSGRAAAANRYACFGRRYDASHLAQHPKQNVVAMKLLVTDCRSDGINPEPPAVRSRPRS